MEKLKCILAYVLGLAGWLVGIVIGIVWNLLYGGYQESNVIDLPMLLAENITPALVSVFLSDYIFKKIFPEINSKRINTIVFYSILFLNYGYILYDTIYTKNYTNLIYVATGVIYLIYLIYKLIKDESSVKKRS